MKLFPWIRCSTSGSEEVKEDADTTSDSSYMLVFAIANSLIHRYEAKDGVSDCYPHNYRQLSDVVSIKDSHNDIIYSFYEGASGRTHHMRHVNGLTKEECELLAGAVLPRILQIRKNWRIAEEQHMFNTSRSELEAAYLKSTTKELHE